MLYYTLLSVTTFMLCLSLFLVYRASNLENAFRKIQGDIILQLNQPRSGGFCDWRLDNLSKTKEGRLFQKDEKASLKLYRRLRREEGTRLAPWSFLQFSANTNRQPYVRGNVTVIPWSVAVKQGHAISPKDQRILVQEGGYYMVFAQVLFKSPDAVMGHVVLSWGSTMSGKRPIELLRCLRATPQESLASTCYAAGLVKLEHEDELELVIPNRPHSLIAMDTESTYFGVMKLN